MEILFFNLSPPRYISYPFQPKWEKVALAVVILFFVCITAYLSCFSHRQKTSDDKSRSIQLITSPAGTTQQTTPLTENINEGTSNQTIVRTESAEQTAPLRKSATFIPFTLQVRKNAYDKPISISIDNPLTVWEFIQKAYPLLYPDNNRSFCFHTQLLGGGQLLNTADNLNLQLSYIVHGEIVCKELTLIEDRTILLGVHQHLESRKKSISPLYENFNPGAKEADKLLLFQERVILMCDQILGGEQEKTSFATLVNLKKVLSDLLQVYSKSQSPIMTKYTAALVQKVQQAIQACKKTPSEELALMVDSAVLSKVDNRLEEEKKYISPLYENFKPGAKEADKLLLFQERVISICTRVKEGRQEENDLQTLCSLRSVLSELSRTYSKSQHLTIAHYISTLFKEVGDAIEAYDEGFPS